MKMKTRVWADPKMEADRVVRDLAKVAFANIADFVQFEGNRIIEVDHVKARDVGAKVKIVTRKVGRGKNMRTVRETDIQLPNKLAALIQLGKHLGLFQNGRKRK
jgi:phage terminase small subunit